MYLCSVHELPIHELMEETRKIVYTVHTYGWYGMRVVVVTLMEAYLSSLVGFPIFLMFLFHMVRLWRMCLGEEEEDGKGRKKRRKERSLCMRVLCKPFSYCECCCASCSSSRYDLDDDDQASKAATSLTTGGRSVNTEEDQDGTLRQSSKATSGTDKSSPDDTLTPPKDADNRETPNSSPVRELSKPSTIDADDERIDPSSSSNSKKKSKSALSSSIARSIKLNVTRRDSNPSDRKKQKSRIKAFSQTIDRVQKTINKEATASCFDAECTSLKFCCPCLPFHVTRSVFFAFFCTCCVPIAGWMSNRQSSMCDIRFKGVGLALFFVALTFAGVSVLLWTWILSKKIFIGKKDGDGSVLVVVRIAWRGQGVLGSSGGSSQSGSKSDGGDNSRLSRVSGQTGVTKVKSFTNKYLHMEKNPVELIMHQIFNAGASTGAVGTPIFGQSPAVEQASPLLEQNGGLNNLGGEDTNQTPNRKKSSKESPLSQIQKKDTPDLINQTPGKVFFQTPGRRSFFRDVPEEIPLDGSQSPESGLRSPERGLFSGGETGGETTEAEGVGGGDSKEDLTAGGVKHPQEMKQILDGGFSDLLREIELSNKMEEEADEDQAALLAATGRRENAKSAKRSNSRENNREGEHRMEGSPDNELLVDELSEGDGAPSPMLIASRDISGSGMRRSPTQGKRMSNQSDRPQMIGRKVLSSGSEDETPSKRRPEHQDSITVRQEPIEDDIASNDSPSPQPSPDTSPMPTHAIASILLSNPGIYRELSKDTVSSVGNRLDFELEDFWHTQKGYDINTERRVKRSGQERNVGLSPNRSKDADLNLLDGGGEDGSPGNRVGGVANNSSGGGLNEGGSKGSFQTLVNLLKKSKGTTSKVDSSKAGTSPGDSGGVISPTNSGPGLADNINNQMASSSKDVGEPVSADPLSDKELTPDKENKNQANQSSQKRKKTQKNKKKYVYRMTVRYVNESHVGHYITTFLLTAIVIAILSLRFHFERYAVLAAEMDDNWGFVLDKELAPVWISEIGTAERTSWWVNMMIYIRSKPHVSPMMDLAYWPWNGYKILYGLERPKYRTLDLFDQRNYDKSLKHMNEESFLTGLFDSEDSERDEPDPETLEEIQKKQAIMWETEKFGVLDHKTNSYQNPAGLVVMEDLFGTSSGGVTIQFVAGVYGRHPPGYGWNWKKEVEAGKVWTWDGEFKIGENYSVGNYRGSSSWSSGSSLWNFDEDEEFRTGLEEKFGEGSVNSLNGTITLIAGRMDGGDLGDWWASGKILGF